MRYVLRCTGAERSGNEEIQGATVRGEEADADRNRLTRLEIGPITLLRLSFAYSAWGQTRHG